MLKNFFIWRKSCFTLFAAGAVLCFPLFSQDKLREIVGTVRDMESLQPLPSANIRVIGTNKGTISNSDGKYRLFLNAREHRIVVSYIGYLSDTLRVPATDSKVPCDVFLKPTTLVLAEVVVTPDMPDAAEEVIRKAIAKKRAVLAELRSYEFDAYVKTVLRVRRAGEAKNDTVIAGILETQTRAYWKSPDKYKEIVVARRQTTNFPEQMNIFTVGRLPNLNDDIVLVRNQRVIGPTAPEAFDYYRYKMIDTTAIDGVTVWRIRIIPRTELIPLFGGFISIADQTFLVMSLDVWGNEALNASPWANIHLQQQFALYEEKFWLPIEIQQSGDINVSIGPLGASVMYSQVCVLHEYRINCSIPDLVFDRYRLAPLAGTHRFDTLAWQRQQVLRLSAEEVEAYRRIDSIMAAPNFRRSVLAFITTAPLVVRKLPLTSLGDFFHFNRVEGFFGGFGLKMDDYLNPTKLSIRAGYGFGDKRPKYGIEIQHPFSLDNGLWFGGEMYQRLQFREGYPQIQGLMRPFSSGTVTWLCLLGKNDPLDYYVASGWSLFGRVDASSSLMLELRYLNERHTTSTQESDFSVFNTSGRYRNNPAILDGRLRSLIVSMSYDTRKFVDVGWFEAADENEHSWTLSAQLEYTEKPLLRSSFAFSRFLLGIRRFQRTLGAGALDVYSKVGYSKGDLPPQRLFDLETAASGVAHKGTFKTAGVKEFSGDVLALLFVEYNFGTIPFQILGLPVLNNFDLILYSGSGWSNFLSRSGSLQTGPAISAKKVFHEAGFALGKVLPFLRVDFTWRLSHQTSRNFAVTFQSSLL